MMRWCAYCQEFQGEVAPLDVFTTTHGICASCLSKGTRRLNTQIPHAHRLRAIQGALYEAGRNGDMTAAPTIIRLAMDAGLQPVDILVGMITPLLYRIGNEWEVGKISIADQQRFSGFCERAYELIREEAGLGEPAFPAADRPFVFLLNVPGNDHNLGIRILSLWLQSKGIRTREFTSPLTDRELLTQITEDEPLAILISLSMPSQLGDLEATVQQIQKLPYPRPLLIVGGYAIKRRLIPVMAGALFIETLTGLDDLIRGLQTVQPAQV